ncbi:hypothetical protein H9623_12410 [Oerskovia sp. Sa1BUA8]|uniref:Uncharacterized protein n=1 Tax=Oerskovia douganii TaxID=2762210 RepID=A0A9D5UHQ4_9CELL|nr:hypothetical protein [Oerskovia douganii]MBE7701102.1 hypothetical protein [Oerskovia douganii]
MAAATKVSEADSHELEAVAAAAGVAQSDVLRAGIELALRGVERERLVAYLEDVGRESASGALTAGRRALLDGAPHRS